MEKLWLDDFHLKAWPSFFSHYFWSFHLFLLVRLYRNSHRSPQRKYRRHTNDLTSSGRASNSSRLRLVATSSQLSIEVSELHALNGRLEISCLATIPAHVKPGEQYADYKTYSVKSKWKPKWRLFYYISNFHSHNQWKVIPCVIGFYLPKLSEITGDRRRSNRNDLMPMN